MLWDWLVTSTEIMASWRLKQSFDIQHWSMQKCVSRWALTASYLQILWYYPQFSFEVLGKCQISALFLVRSASGPVRWRRARVLFSRAIAFARDTVFHKHFLFSFWRCLSFKNLSLLFYITPHLINVKIKRHENVGSRLDCLN